MKKPLWIDTTIQLDAEETETVLDLLRNPPKPNEALLNLFLKARLQERVVELETEIAELKKEIQRLRRDLGDIERSTLKDR